MPNYYEAGNFWDNPRIDSLCCKGAVYRNADIEQLAARKVINNNNMNNNDNNNNNDNDDNKQHNTMSSTQPYHCNKLMSVSYYRLTV